MNRKKSFCVVSSLIIIAVLLMCGYFYLGIERVDYDMIEVQKAGEIHDYTEQGQELEDLARFALEDYSHYVNCIFEFHRVVKVKVKEGQLISGKMYHLTIETKGGTLYEAKVWVKPWKNIKELVEFEAIKAPNVNNW